MKKCISLIFLLFYSSFTIFAGFTPEAQLPEDAILNGNISSITIQRNVSQGEPSFTAQYFLNNQLVKKETVHKGKTTNLELYSNGLLIYRENENIKNKGFKYKIDIKGNIITQYRDINHKTLLIYKNNKLVEKKFYQYSDSEEEWYKSGSTIYYEYDPQGRISKKYELTSDGVEYLKSLYFYNETEIERLDQLLRNDLKILNAHILTNDSIPIMTKKQHYPMDYKKEGPLTEKESSNLERETIEYNDKGLPIIHSFYRSYNPKPFQFFTYEYEYDEKGNWIKSLITSHSEKYKDTEHRRITREIIYYE